MTHGFYRHTKEKAPFAVRNFEVIEVAIGLCALAVFAVGVKTFRPLPGFTARAFKDAIWIAVFLYFLRTLFFWKTVRWRSKNSSLFLLVSSVTSYMISVGGLLTANAVLDRQPAVSHRVTVLKREDVQDAKGRKMDFLTVSSWRTGETSETISSTAQVPVSEMEKLSKGDTVELQVKQGRFGYEWLVGMSILKAATNGEGSLRVEPR